MDPPLLSCYAKLFLASGATRARFCNYPALPALGSVLSQLETSCQ
jgi:hypothetical protein